MRSAKSVTAAFVSALLAMAGPLGADQRRGPTAVVDSLGRKVAVPGKILRLISLEPEVTRIIVALGAGEKLVGIDYFLHNHDYLFPLVFPAARSLPVVSNQGQELNYELAVSLRPDIIIASPSEYRMTEAIERKMRVPVVAMASMGRFRDLLDEIEALGRILDREERAAELTGLFEERLETLGRIQAQRPEQARPSVYLAFWNSLVRTPVSYDPVDAAGGRNVAAGVMPSYLGTTGTTVSVERILLWDPDVILVQGNYRPEERLVTVKGVLDDPRLAAVKAVRTGRVHYVFGFWYWWDPALVLVETFYLSRVLRSEAIPWPELLREGDAVFKSFYGVEGIFGALDRILACHEWATR